jgi:tRNA pseudouridine(38-40) synthase
MLKNFKITIEYDGSAYHGWQRQSTERTIQEEIEKALMTLTGKRVVLTGSGRTDAGVHAFGQAANFHCDTSLDPEVIQKGLNSLLPEDIVITACIQVSDKFHARYDVKSKTYHYRILNRTLDLWCEILSERLWMWDLVKSHPMTFTEYSLQKIVNLPVRLRRHTVCFSCGSNIQASFLTCPSFSVPAHCKMK